MISGNVWKYGDNVNTDVIYPGKYLYTISDPAEMAGHALEGLDNSFAETMQAGDIIVAGQAAVFCVVGYPEGPLDPVSPWPKWQHDLYNSGCLSGGR